MKAAIKVLLALLSSLLVLAGGAAARADGSRATSPQSRDPGEHLLRPHQVPRLASRSLRLLAGSLYVAVPDDDPRIVSLRLPSLATERERTFAVPASLRTPFSSSIALSTVGDGLLIGVGETFVLSPKLVTVAHHRAPITQPIAFDRSSGRILATDGEPCTLASHPVRVLRDGAAEEKIVIFAHGRGVVIASTEDAPATIRVLP